MHLEKLKINSADAKLFASIFTLLILRIYTILFPTHYQQDDVSELRVTYFDDFFCAIYYGGDNHPIFSSLIWIMSKFSSKPEYLISVLIIVVTSISLFQIFKLVTDKFSFEVAIISFGMFIFSPALTTYTVSLKQYMFEFFASIYVLSFIYKNIKSDYRNFRIKKFLIISAILFSISFVNIIPIFVGLLFILLRDKKVNLKLLILFLLPITPFINSFTKKAQRVNQGGYWDSFFITNTENMNLLENLNFLTSLFIKSYLPENINYLGIILFILSILFAIYSRDTLIQFALLGTFLIFLLSAIQFYPLGAGRTDLVFFPFAMLIFCNFIYKALNFFEIKPAIILSLLVIFTINGIVNSKPFYKDENIEPVIELFEEKFNNDSYEIIVIKDQAPSLFYYSKELSIENSSPDLNSCMKKVSYFENVSVLNNNGLIKNIYSTPSEVSLNDLNRENLILFGVELPGTEGSFRLFIEEIKKDYIQINYIEFDNYMKLFYFDKNE